MEHEVFVPVPAPSLRRTLGDPARVARCVPGLQQDAEASAGPLAGRLKIRADGHTITYRGALRLSGPDGDRFSVTGEGAEARGTGAAKLELSIGLTETDGGTTLTFTGTASGDGRLKELDAAAALSAAHRLLDRFTQQLVTETLASHEGEQVAPVAGSTGDASADEGVRRPPRPKTRSRPKPRPRPTTRLCSAMTMTMMPRAGWRPSATRRCSTRPCRPLARPRRRGGVHRAGRAPGRGGARPADHDRAQCRGGRPRSAARPVRPRALARRERCGHRPALGRPRRRPRDRLRRRAGPGAATPEVAAPVVSGV